MNNRTTECEKFARELPTTQDSFKNAEGYTFYRSARIPGAWETTLHRSYSGIGHNEYAYICTDTEAVKKHYGERNVKISTIILGTGGAQAVYVEDWRW